MNTTVRIVVLSLICSLCFCQCTTANYSTGGKNTEGIGYVYDNISGHWIGDDVDDVTTELFTFNTNELSVTYSYSSYPGDEEYEILAKGTFRIEKWDDSFVGTLRVHYTDVSVYTSGGSGFHNGFVDGSEKHLSYAIRASTENELVLVGDSGDIHFGKYEEIK